MNRAKYIAFLGVLSLGFYACAGSTQLSTELELHIDPRIQGIERKAITEVMQYVPEQYRDDEVLFLNDDGTLYSNKPEFRNQYMVKVEKSSVETPEVTTRSTACTPSPTGLIRRLKTKPGLPVGPASATARFAYSSSSVFLPVSSDVKKKSDESAFVYLGGSAPSEVDAGLALLPGVDYWQLWLGKPGETVYSINRPTGTFAAGSQVLLEFIVNTNIVEIRYTGLRIGDTVSRTTSLFKPVAGYRADGWKNALKRLTTLSWKAGTGKGRSGSFVNNVTWADARLAPADPVLTGGNVFGLHSWGDSGYDIDTTTDGDCVSPGVTVDSFGSFANETVSIVAQ